MGNSGTTAEAAVETAAAAVEGLPLGWVRVADLAEGLGRSPRRLRQWVALHVPEALQQRVQRPGGGSPELWVHPDARAQLVAALDTSRAAEPAGEAAVETAEALPLDQAAAWRAALDAERSRADAAEATARRAEARAETLAGELRGLRVELDAARRVAADAERARLGAERLVDELRGTVWAWVAGLQRRSWWRRLGRLPDPPAGLVALDRRIEQRAD